MGATELKERIASLEANLAEERCEFEKAEAEIEGILSASGDVAGLRKKLSEARPGRDILGRRVAAPEKRLRAAEAEKKAMVRDRAAKELEQKEAELGEHTAEVDSALVENFGEIPAHNFRHPGNQHRNFVDDRVNDATRHTPRERALVEEVESLRKLENQLTREIAELTA